MAIALTGAAGCGATELSGGGDAGLDAGILLGDGGLIPARDASAADARDDASIGTDGGTAGDAASQIEASPPPWELDGGGASDAGCAGQVVSSGACLRTLASGQAVPWGITVDATSVYFTNQGSALDTGTVAKVDRSGGMPVTLASGLRAPHDIAVDGTNVYWAGSSIMSVGLDGGTPQTLFDDYDSTSFVTRAGERLFWADNEAAVDLRSAFTDGSGLEALTMVSPYQIGGVAASSTGIVFSETSDQEGNPGLLLTATLDGTESMILTVPGSLGLVKSANDVVVYSDGLNGIYWIPLEGGTPGLLTTDAYPTDIVTDGTFVYWTDAGLQGVVKLNILSGAPEVLVSSFDDPAIFGAGSLMIDANTVYFTEPGGCPTDGPCVGKVFSLSPR